MIYERFGAEVDHWKSMILVVRSWMKYLPFWYDLDTILVRSWCEIYKERQNTIIIYQKANNLPVKIYDLKTIAEIAKNR